MPANSMPNHSVPFLDAKGLLTPEWYLFLLRLKKELPDDEDDPTLAAAALAATDELQGLIDSTSAAISALASRIYDADSVAVPRPERVQRVQTTAAGLASYPASSFNEAEAFETDTYVRRYSSAGAWSEALYPALLKLLGSTSSFPAWKRSSAILQARLADDSAYTDVEVLDEAFGSSWNGSLEVPTKNAIYDAFVSGTYTPTLTNVANLAASTAYECQYARVWNVVTVSGRVDVDPTIAAATQLRISLPIASNIGATEDVGGVAFCSGVAGQGAGIYGDAANNAALMQWIAVDLANQAMHFIFQYQVI